MQPACSAPSKEPLGSLRIAAKCQSPCHRCPSPDCSGWRACSRPAAHHPSWRRSPAEGLAGWQPTLPYPPTPSSQSLLSGRLQIWISVAPTLALDIICTLMAVWEKWISAGTKHDIMYVKQASLLRSGGLAHCRQGACRQGGPLKAGVHHRAGGCAGECHMHA